jgi:septum formation inhibitor MinC
MKIAIETIENLQESLKSLPAVEVKKREVSKPEAVQMLAAQVAELQEKGYTIEMIAEIFTASGLEIKPQTLKSYLTRAKGLKGPKKRSSKAPARTPAKPLDNSGQKASDEANKKQENANSVTNKTATDDSEDGAPAAATPSGNKTTTKEPVKSGTFQPRGDSREI